MGDCTGVLGGRPGEEDSMWPWGRAAGGWTRKQVGLRSWDCGGVGGGGGAIQGAGLEPGAVPWG